MKSIFTILLISTAVFGHSQPGTLDAGFGSNGTLTIDGFGHEDKPTGLGSYNNVPVMAGYSVDFLYEFVVFKFNEDGSPDLAFSSDGMQSNDFFEDSNAFCSGMVILDNGKIVLGGHSTNPGEFVFFQGFMKFSAGGSLDTSFGDNGKLIIWDEGNESIRCWDMIRQSNNHILAVGSYGFSPSWASVTRIDEDGNIDYLFGNSGLAWYASDNQATAGYGVVEMPSGRIISAGSALDSDAEILSYLVAFDPDGELDTNFGTDGEVITAEPGTIEEYRAIANYDDTHFIVGGQKGEDVERDGLVRRYDVDGNLDTSFGDGGTVLIDYLGFKDDVIDIITDPEGNIIVGLEGEDESGEDDFVVVRLLADGSIDSTFGNNGFFAITGETDDDITRIALQEDGRILVAGVRDDEDSDTGLDNFLIRLLGGMAIGIEDLGAGSMIPLIYPNPVQSSATFEFELSRTQDLVLQLLDASGRTVQIFESGTSFSGGKHSYPMELEAGLPSGMYFLSLIAEEGQVSVRIEIQN